MKALIRFLIYWTITIAVSLRYRLKIKGLKNINNKVLTKPGGILFLPNHPARMDPIVAFLALWKKCPLRPVIMVDYFFTPGVSNLVSFLRGVGIPNFDFWNNSFKKYKGEQSFKEIIDGVKQGDNFLLYPSGRLKNSAGPWAMPCWLPMVLSGFTMSVRAGCSPRRKTGWPMVSISAVKEETNRLHGSRRPTTRPWKMVVSPQTKQPKARGRSRNTAQAHNGL